MNGRGHIEKNWINSKKTASPLKVTLSLSVCYVTGGIRTPTVRLEGGCSILLSYYDNSCNTTKLIIMEVVLESQSEI